MVIDRRKALVAITAAFGQIAKGNWRGHPAVAPGNRFSSDGTGLDDAGDGGASLDLSQIGTHVYSEEGIPMFLGCENTTTPEARLKASDLNRQVSSAFERYAQEWSRLHPRAAAGDAAKLVEFLAGRDFTSGGLEASL